MSRRVFGITGWKNSGKTTLTEKLVSELVRRGWTVSTVKHAHHEFDIDKPGADSFRHRQAGATEVEPPTDRRGEDARQQKRQGKGPRHLPPRPAQLLLHDR